MATPSRATKRKKIRTISQAIQPERLEQRWLFAGISGDVTDGFRVFNGAGNTNAAASLTAFQTAIGGASNGVLPPQSAGSRRINWDGVKPDGTDFGGLTQTFVPGKTVGIPVNRFQANGALYDKVTAVSGDGFATTQRGINGQINAFSPGNTFDAINDTVVHQSFIKPSASTTAPVHEATRGFGAIFLDVERPNSSYIEYFHGSDSLGKFFVQPGPSGQAEFLGVLFNSSIVTDVKVHAGTSPMFFNNLGRPAAGRADLSNGGIEDMAALDDFVYAEPKSVAAAPINHAVEGAKFTGTVGRFSTSNINPQAGDFTATVLWGDGTSSSAGTVVASAGGGFAVNASHTYAEEGSFKVTVQLKDKLGHTGATQSITEVADAPLTSSGFLFNATNVEPFSGIVATFHDANLAQSNPANYRALIDWGDGIGIPPSIGEFVSLGGGNWAVSGVHQYIKTDQFFLKITITDIAGSTTTAASMVTVV